MEFWKMNGAGNDFIVVDDRRNAIPENRWPEIVRVLCERHMSIGADGFMVVKPPTCGGDYKMLFFNSDGSTGEMCGNGARCIGKYVYDRGLTDKTTVSLMTDSGLKILNLNVKDGKVQTVRVDMGMPELFPPKIPVDLPGEVVMGHRLNVGSATYEIHCVSMGNPHCVIFVRDPDYVDLEQIGPLLENNAIFPQRANVEFVQVVSRDHLRMRVWERGAGETLECGPGARASVARGCGAPPPLPPCCDGFARRLVDAGLVA